MLPATRVAGIVLGAMICAAGFAIVVRHKAYGHVAPSVALTALSALELTLLVR